MRPVLALLAAACLSGGCSGDDRPAGGRAAPSYRAAAAREPEAAARRAAHDAGVARLAVVEVVPPLPPPDAGSERDLDEELRARMGDVTSCLRWTAEAPPRIDVAVTVTVSSAGVVTRTAASGTGLDGEAIACLRARAGALRFAGPVPGAPRTASARFEVLSRRPAAPPAAEEAPAVRPGVALVPVVPGVPIQGPEGRELEGPEGSAVEGPAGRPIEARPGLPVAGPAGVPIGAGD